MKLKLIIENGDVPAMTANSWLMIKKSLTTLNVVLVKQAIHSRICLTNVFDSTKYSSLVVVFVFKFCVACFVREK